MNGKGMVPREGQSRPLLDHLFWGDLKTGDLTTAFKTKAFYAKGAVPRGMHVRLFVFFIMGFKSTEAGL